MLPKSQFQLGADRNYAPDSPGEDGELYIVLYTIYGKLYDKHKYT